MRGSVGWGSASAKKVSIWEFQVRSGSVWVLPGSVQDPFGSLGVRWGFVRDPFEGRAGFVQVPFGFRSGSETAAAKK